MHSAISLGGVAFGFLSLWRFIGFGAALPARLACGTDQRLARTLNECGARLPLHSGTTQDLFCLLKPQMRRQTGVEPADRLSTAR